MRGPSAKAPATSAMRAPGHARRDMPPVPPARSHTAVRDDG